MTGVPPENWFRPPLVQEPLAPSRLRLCAIIPALNESAGLGATLASLAAQSEPLEAVVVADGGSTDGTAGLARAAGAMVLGCGRVGRGCQIAEALGTVGWADAVVIVHADMRLPIAAAAAIRKVLYERPGCPGGCLGHRFDRRWPTSWLVEGCDWVRARGFGISYGDQAQFFRPADLERVGGFPRQPIMEDLELARRLRRAGQPVYLGLPATVSYRRFERLGFWRTVWTNLRLRRAYRIGGVDACRAIYERYYPKPAAEP